MALSADLSLKLDARALVSTFTGALGARAGALGAVAVPDTTAGLQGIGAALSTMDTGALAPAVNQLVQQGSQALATLGPVPAPLAALQSALELVELATEGDLRADLEALVVQLRGVLEGRREGGTFGTVLRLVDLINGASSTGLLATLLQRVLGISGVVMPPAVHDASTLLPAVDSLVRAVGGLMMLESVLAESQRLMGVMADQLDAGAVQRRVAALQLAFDDSLVQRINTTSAADAVALDALVDLLAGSALQLDDLQQTLAAGMGLGEATLAHLDVARVQSEVAAAATLLRGIDLDPLARQLQGALSGLAPLMAMDLGSVPAQSLDALLGLAEAQVASLAVRISAWNPDDLAAPLQQGLDQLTAPLADLSRLADEAVVQVRAGLEAVRRVVVALPVGALADAVQAVLAPVTQVLGLITSLVAEVAAALQTAADAAVRGLGEAEAVVDAFQAEVQALFAEARSFVEGLNLDSLAGTLGDRVNEFTQALAQAQLKPYFDTAVSAIDAAADVVGAVPFGLLPADMKADVDAAVAPIKATDLGAFEAQIEAAVGIGADGRFTPRADLDAALAQVQQKFDALVATLKGLNPTQHLATLDTHLATLADRVRALAPAVTLQPVQDVVDQVKAAVAGFNPAQQIAPLQQVFDDALQALQAYSPAQLIVPLQQRVDTARDKVTSTLRLDQWTPALDDVQAQATSLLNRLDPLQLEAQLADLLGQGRGLLASVPDINPQWLGTLVAGLHRGSLARIDPRAFAPVAQWINDRSGAQALTARSAAIADAVARTHSAVSGIDLAGLSATLGSRLAAVRSALNGLLSRLAADAPQRAAFATLVLRLDVQAGFSDLAANRARYLAALTAALPLGDTLRRTGLSEVDTTLAKLHTTFAPVTALLAWLRGFLRAAGVPQAGASVPRMLQAVLDVAPPARLAALTAPLFVALRDRVLALLNAVLLPLKTGVARIQTLLAALDLGPLVQAVDAVFKQAVAELQALSPASLLAGPLGAVTTLKAQVAAFNPLAALLTVLNALRDKAARLLGKLSAQKLLADPVAIYGEIVEAIDALNVQALMAPVLDLLDSVAHDVDAGLDDTVTAFRRLQDALPAGGGGSSVSVEILV